MVDLSRGLTRADWRCWSRRNGSSCHLIDIWQWSSISEKKHKIKSCLLTSNSNKCRSYLCIWDYFVEIKVDIMIEWEIYIYQTFLVQINYIQTTIILIIKERMRSLLRFNPTRRGAFKAPPEQKSRFWHLFVIQMTQKNASHTLLVLAF